VSSLKSLDTGDFMRAWGGIGSLGLGFSLLYTEGSKRRVDSLLGRIALWCTSLISPVLSLPYSPITLARDSSGSQRPAAAAGLSSTKGQIAPGFDADFAIFDPSADFVVSKAELKFRNKLSPYEGKELRGRVEQTILRGKTVWKAEWNVKVDGLGKPTGKLL
jgi:allantoinase